MPLDSNHRVTILDIAVRLHCASPALNKDTDAVLVTAEKFASFAETESVAPKATRKTKTPDAAPVVSVDAEQAANDAPVEPVKEPAKEAAKVEQKTAATTPSVAEADVKAAVGKVATNAAAGGAPKAREILAKYDATNISTLKPENYAKALADLNAVLKAAQDAADIAA